MKIKCPKCCTSYVIGGISRVIIRRSLRCSTCGHIWRQSLSPSEQSLPSKTLHDVFDPHYFEFSQYPHQTFLHNHQMVSSIFSILYRVYHSIQKFLFQSLLKKIKHHHKTLQDQVFLFHKKQYLIYLQLFPLMPNILLQHLLFVHPMLNYIHEYLFHHNALQ